MQSPITISTDHYDAQESLHHTFEMAVESDDGAVDEGWTVKMDIPEWGLADGEFEVETFWVDCETGKEYPASPLDVRVRDEIEKLTEDACRDAAYCLIQSDPWADAGVSWSDFI